MNEKVVFRLIDFIKRDFKQEVHSFKRFEYEFILSKPDIVIAFMPEEYTIENQYPFDFFINNLKSYNYNIEIAYLNINDGESFKKYVFLFASNVDLPMYSQFAPEKFFENFNKKLYDYDEIIKQINQRLNEEIKHYDPISNLFCSIDEEIRFLESIDD